MNDLSITPPQLTKAAIEAAGTRYAEALLDEGKQEVLPAYMRLRALRDAIDQALKTLESGAMDEAEMYPKGDRQRLGVKFQVRDGRQLWDFSHDTTWQMHKEQERLEAEARKKRETFLKALDQEVVDPTTGEFVTPAVVKGYAKSALALTFPKGGE